MQDTNLCQPTELCYTNEHVDIIIVHHVTSSKTQRPTKSITLLWARQTLMPTILWKFEMFDNKPFRHQLRLRVGGMSAAVSRRSANRGYWTTSEWARFCVLQKLDFIGSSHEGSCSTILTGSVSDWGNRWSDCIMRWINTFKMYFY